MLRRFVSWFGTLPAITKILLAFVALFVLGLSVALSPLVTVVAFIVFFIALLALVFRATRGRSVKTWGIIAGTSLVFVLVFSGISASRGLSSSAFLRASRISSGPGSSFGGM